MITPIRDGFRRFATLLVLIGVAVSLPGAFADEVGRIAAARGAVTVESADGAVRLAGRSDPLSPGDVLNTGPRSFAILEFDDGTRMSLRPETVFKVEAWSSKENEESAVTQLFRGGLRAITGFITQRNVRAFRMRTPVATIGIRGTTFDARLCEGDECLAEARGGDGAAAAARSQAVGRVGFVHGTATSRRRGADYARPVEAGSPLYEGDTVATTRNSFAVLVFSDHSRVTLRANTVFRIEAHAYAPDRAAEDSSIFRLVRGGLRAVTGLIGKRNADRVRFRTAVATIGIRGTGFDLVCGGVDGGDADDAWLATRNLLRMLLREAQAQQADGLPPGCLARPFKDSIFIETEGERLDVPEGSVYFVPLATREPRELPGMPFPIEEPRPDEVEIDEEALFRYEEAREGAPGLHVACLEGAACVVGEEILAAGESFYQTEDGTVVIRSAYAPGFLVNDKYFKTIDVPPEVLDMLYDVDAGAAGECTVAR